MGALQGPGAEGLDLIVELAASGEGGSNDKEIAKHLRLWQGMGSSDRAPNPKVAGSNPTPAIEKGPAKQALFCGRLLGVRWCRVLSGY